jgi:hypothetical protein
MYVLVANTSNFADNVTVKLLLEGGGTLTSTFSFPPSAA